MMLDQKTRSLDNLVLRTENEMPETKKSELEDTSDEEVNWSRVRFEQTNDLFINKDNVDDIILRIIAMGYFKFVNNGTLTS